MHPYRTRLNPPDAFDEYWRPLERRRALLRRLPRVAFVLASLPALAIAAGGWLEMESRVSAPELERALGEPWGLRVTQTDATAYAGAHAGAPLPDRDASSIPAQQLQREIAAHVAKPVRECYQRVLAVVPDAAGELVVSIAARGDGTHRVALGGPAALRRSVGGCVEGAFTRLSLPATPEPLWVHYPLRFEP